jgi:hypothetical protein
MDRAEIEALIVRLMRPRALWQRFWEDPDRTLAAKALTHLMMKVDRVEGQLVAQDGRAADLEEHNDKRQAGLGSGV